MGKTKHTPLAIRQYQKQAQTTDQFTKDDQSIANSVANLLEEVGALHRWYQQDLQSKSKESIFAKRAPAKIGDILWYLSSIATRSNWNLEAIARGNLEKAAQRWGKSREYLLFDIGYPPDEQLPRTCEFTIVQEPSGKVKFSIHSDAGRLSLGDPVDDNAYENDGYRFHDVLHLSYAAYLGWSPVLRALLKRKRKSNKQIDVVEDGARARDLEEALTAFIYEHAKTVDYFAGQTVVDFKLLKVIERLTLTREVSRRSPQHWQEAILGGYNVFRKVHENHGGLIKMDMVQRTLRYQPLPANILKSLPKH